MRNAILSLAVAMVTLAPALATERTRPVRPELYFWIWWSNLEGHWQELIDFAAERKMDGVVIWGLQGWKDDGKRCREVVAYAHDRGVKVIHGLGLNGYEVGHSIVAEHPELAATIGAKLADTDKARGTRRDVFCPSKPEALKLLEACLLRAAATGIDGFNFETADVDYLTCHCPQCQKRFQSADETEHHNKPMGWPLEHLKFAADVLTKSHPELWLNCEFAMQRFGTRPYTDCDRILEMNRRIDPRITVVWAEGTAPPEEIAQRLWADRENIGWYVRSGAIHGWTAGNILPPQRLLPIAQRLIALRPVTMMYRCSRPLDRFAVNMGAAAEILRNPGMSPAEVDRIVAEWQKTIRPGGRYSLVRRIAPGNLIAPGGPAKLEVSSGTATRLVDGVADPNQGIWHTARNSPKAAWAIAEWCELTTVDRVRLFHQINGHYRALDYTVQYEKDDAWHDLPGMPVKDNSIHGWSEHAFPPVTTRRMRLLITRSEYGNRMGMGEWEVYGPNKQ